MLAATVLAGTFCVLWIVIGLAELFKGHPSCSVEQSEDSNSTKRRSYNDTH